LKFFFERKIMELLAVFFRGSKYSLKIKIYRVDSRFCLKEVNLSAEKRVREIQQFLETENSATI